MDAISHILRFHPVGCVGSLLAGPQQQPQWARVDASPDELEQQGLGERLVRFLPRRATVRRLAESAS
jgi:hypothetical protein